MPLQEARKIVERIKAFQQNVRDLLIRSRETSGLHEISRSSAADTIYRIDSAVEPMLIDFCQQWAQEDGPLVLVAEGLADERGHEVESLIFPRGARESEAKLRMIVDPIDGTRGLMYDKRSAWALAGVAPNKGPGTRMRDIEVAVMTELPTSKMGFADVLWAIKGHGTQAAREDLSNGKSLPLSLRPSAAENIDHGFASVVNFFPGTKVIAGQLVEHLARKLIHPSDIGTAIIFDDQYISTGGQWYELIAGHDRFIADLRPEFFRMQKEREGMCCHPYDCAAWLVAEEAGVVLTDAKGQPLDGPMDTTTGVSWIAYANSALRQLIEPHLMEFMAMQ